MKRPGAVRRSRRSLPPPTPVVAPEKPTFRLSGPQASKFMRRSPRVGQAVRATLRGRVCELSQERYGSDRGKHHVTIEIDKSEVQ